MTKLLKIDGIKVKDAKKPVRLIVTEDDCKRANRKRPESCAVARACSRMTDVDEARIHLSRVYLRRGEEWFRYTTPPSMRDEIIAFDRGGSFEPQEFRLTAPRPSIRLGKHREAGAKTGKQKRRKPHVVTNVRAMAV